MKTSVRTGLLNKNLSWGNKTCTEDTGQTGLTCRGDRLCRQSRPRSPPQSCSRQPEERPWRWRPPLCSVWTPAPDCPAGKTRAALNTPTKQLIFTTASPFIVHTSWTYLRLGEHVQAPGAHFAISGDADQVVGVLGSDHVHTVDWVLDTAEEDRQKS